MDSSQHHGARAGPLQELLLGKPAFTISAATQGGSYQVRRDATKREEGFILVAVALTLIILIGFVALGVDTGVLYGAKTSAPEHRRCRSNGRSLHVHK